MPPACRAVSSIKRARCLRAQQVVDLEPDNHSTSYHAILQATAGAAIVQRSRLRAQQPEGSRIISLPANMNSRFAALSRDGELEDVGFYYFDVTRK